MKIIEKEIKDIDLNELSSLINTDEFTEYFLDKDREHYHLLAYLSTKFDNELIIDLGTHRGTSALALSYNKTNKVITYDVREFRGGIVHNINDIPENIEWKIKNIMDDDAFSDRENLLKSKLIFLDTAHEGDFEYDVYKYLKDGSYNGILVLDDIHFNGKMKDFWEKIDTTKYDVTHLGHSIESSGTGLVDFSGKVEEIE